MMSLAGGCRSGHPIANPSRASDFPAVVPLIHDNAPGGALNLVGSGVPRAGGRVITAMHVIEHQFPTPPGGICAPVYEIGWSRSRVAALVSGEPNGDDIGWIDTGCAFDRTDRISTDPPPTGTRVTLAGYPGAVFSAEDFASVSFPPPYVLEGTVIDKPADLPSPNTRVIWVQIPGVWSEFMHGFSGGPCAYKDEAGDWVVFGIAQLRLGDEVWELLGLNLPIHASKRHAIVAIAPIPRDWEE